MTDTTDDIAVEISFQSYEDDCKMLGNLLLEVLQREAGVQMRDKVDRNRILAQVHLPSFFISHAFAFIQIFVVIVVKVES